MSEIVRTHDTQGNLMSCGYAWQEERSYVTLAAVVGVAIGVGGIVFCIAMAMRGHQMPITVWQMTATFVLSTAIGYGGCQLWDEWRYAERSIIFHRDGRILMPSGVPGYFRQDHIDGSHRYITSVGKLSHKLPERSNVTYSVGMYARNGNVIHITSKDYSHDFAHMVSVQAMNALQELRDTITDPNYFEYPPSSNS
ncbi:hypothetical protein AB7828_30765 [Tardiphaga sp. 215_C5_N2_1]|uniref:hypothetical protein n=1 Tax=Tardiphaga sp. 215_C5_N2_1 TaxID=3240774 RepID=UPI003F8CC8D6